MNSNDTDSVKPAPAPSKGIVPWRIALIVIFAVCLLKFAWVLRAGADFCDLRTPLYASRLLLRGQDPYDDVNIKKLWIADTGLTKENIQSLSTADIPGMPQFPLLYFPFYLGGLCALALFSFKIASSCFVFVSVRVSAARWPCLGGTCATSGPDRSCSRPCLF